MDLGELFCDLGTPVERVPLELRDSDRHEKPDPALLKLALEINASLQSYSRLLRYESAVSR